MSFRVFSSAPIWEEQAKLSHTAEGVKLYFWTKLSEAAQLCHWRLNED